MYILANLGEHVKDQAWYHVYSTNLSKETVWKIVLAHVRNTHNLYTVKNAVELLDVPSKNNSLMMKKYNTQVKLLFLYTHVLFFNSVIE